MYADSPHSAVSNPTGRPYGAPHQTQGFETPPTNQQPGPTGYAAAPQAAPAAPGWSQPAAPRRTDFITGAYMPSGDYMIDRMIMLEKALKQNSRGF
jgi:hypothetical protein